MIRPFEMSDFAQVCAMGALMHQESDFREFVYDPAVLLDFADLVAGSSHLHALVSKNENGLTGMFVGGVSPFFFSTDAYLFDIVFYVRPEVRGGTTAPRLLRAFLAWGRSRGAKQARFGAATGINPETADKFFLGMGFQRGGVLYTLPLTDAEARRAAREPPGGTPL